MSASNRLPPLYRSVAFLNREQHRDLRLRSDPKFRFAAKQPTFPITLPEFSEASRSAPVVFARGPEGLVAVMVTGLSDRRNGLSGDDGRWRSGTYVPAYVRRYPFILIDTDKGRRIGLDPDAWHLSSVEGELLFEGGKDGVVISRVREFCVGYAKAWDETEAFMKSLDDAGVLMPAQTTLSQQGVEPRQIRGFEIVDPEKLHALPAETLASWERSGYLPAIHAHRASLERWKDLAGGGLSEAV